MQRIDATTLDLQERLVSVNRVAKVVKGGKNMRFSALVVVGDGNGHVGCGIGKAIEIPEAIRKAVEQAKRSLVEVPMKGTTIPHEIKGKFNTARVLLLPAGEGTGVIAGNSARAVLEMAGVKDVKAKCYGTTNPVNAVKATIEGLANLRNAEEFAKLRGITVEQMGL